MDCFAALAMTVVRHEFTFSRCIARRSALPSPLRFALNGPLPANKMSDN
jgi:hypothetical protein